MVFEAALLNTQNYKITIKGKVEQSKEWSSAPIHLGVVASSHPPLRLPTLLTYIHSRYSNLEYVSYKIWGVPVNIVVNVQEYIVVSEFELQSSCNDHFEKGMNLLMG